MGHHLKWPLCHFAELQIKVVVPFNDCSGASLYRIRFIKNVEQLTAKTGDAVLQ